MFESDMTAEETIDVMTLWENAHQGLENAHKTAGAPERRRRCHHERIAERQPDRRHREREPRPHPRRSQSSKTILGTAESDTNRVRQPRLPTTSRKKAKSIAPKMKRSAPISTKCPRSADGTEIYISRRTSVPEDAGTPHPKEMQAVMGRQRSGHERQRSAVRSIGDLRTGRGRRWK